MEKKSIKRGVSNATGTLLPLYLILAIRKLGTEEKPVTPLEITRWIEDNYGDEFVPSRATLYRELSNLCNSEFFSGQDETDKKKSFGNFGYCICEKQNDNGKKAYYAEHEITTEEIIMLMDAVEAFAYIDNKDTKSLISKFENLLPVIRRKNNSGNPEKVKGPNNDNILQNINILKEIIDAGHNAKILNGYYGIEKGKIKLMQRTKEHQLIKPLDLMWSNGYYYLIAYMPPHREPVTLRLDRLMDIEEIEDNMEGEMPDYAEYQPTSYQATHPVMGGGKAERIEMLCHITPKNGMMNGIIDTFGMQVMKEKVRIPSEDELKKLLGENSEEILEKYKDSSQEKGSNDTWVVLSLKAAEYGTTLFAIQYSTNCKVLSPPSIAEKVKNAIKTGKMYYE